MQYERAHRQWPTIIKPESSISAIGEYQRYGDDVGRVYYPNRKIRALRSFYYGSCHVGRWR